MIAHYVASPLVYIINKIFELGICPRQFKTAKIFKSGNRTVDGNYRPRALYSR